MATPTEEQLDRAAYERARRSQHKDEINARRRAAYAADRDRFRAYQRRNRAKNGRGNYDERCNHLQRKYGITAEEYDALLAQQNGRCAVCGTLPQDRRLAVDHNHQTGEIRGLLCLPCNASLGQAGDSVERLLALAAYLVSYEDVVLETTRSGLPCK